MKMNRQTLSLAFATLALFCAGDLTLVHAQELITNGSFENTNGTFVDEGGGVMLTALTPGSTIIPGWTVTNDQLAWLMNGNSTGISTPFGSFLLDLTGNHDNGSYAGVTQTIRTIPSETYTLSLSLGADQDIPTFGGTKSVLVTAGTASTSFTFMPTGSGNQWGDFSFDFVATSPSTAISITGISSGAGNQYLGLDNVSVSVVPEPSAGALFLGGVVLLYARRRKV